MSFILLGSILQGFVQLLLGGVALFLILLILVQRGRGGGLAGAFGGMGGSSAFGAKAGDVFTKITIVAASVWIVLCIAAANLAPVTESRLDTGGGLGGTPAPAADDGPALGGLGTEDDESTDDSDSAAEEPAEEVLDEIFEEDSATEETAEPAEDSAAEEATEE